MGREPGPHTGPRRVGTQALDELLGPGEVTLSRAIEQRMTHHRAQPARLHRRRHRVHVAIAVGDRRHAVADQLETAGQGAPPQIVRAEPPLQRKQPAGEPLAARHVLGEAAEHPHRRVRVRVDEPGQEHAAAEIDHLARRPLRRWPHGRDLGPHEGDGARSVDRPLRVEREDLIGQQHRAHVGGVSGFQRTMAFSSSTTARKKLSARNEPTAVVAYSSPVRNSKVATMIR